MLTYMEVHLYFLIPPILSLLLLYWPILGRRDGIKLVWLCFMATIWTTPWDNWILHQSGWEYPAGSIIGRIGLVPVEEHLFFLFQPIFLVLLHSTISHSTLLPFNIPIPHLARISNGSVSSRRDAKSHSRNKTVQTLPRQPIQASVWVLLSALGAMLVHEAHHLDLLPVDLGLGKHAFYLGWILIWICPVIAFLVYLGAQFRRTECWTLGIGVGWLWTIDTVSIAIRSGSWSISSETTLGINLWRGLPSEEAIFFILVSHLLVISCSLISHLHALCILSPSLSPCPSSNPITHIAYLGQIAMNPPEVDLNLLHGLQSAIETLREGSKSFTVAQLAFGREIRIGLIAVYAWCRVTDNLIDDTPKSSDSASLSGEQTLEVIRRHLSAAFNGASQTQLQSILDEVLPTSMEISTSTRAAFHIFSSLIPRLSPIEPFQELCKGYETDLKFLPAPSGTAISEKHLPIKSEEDLLEYADDVAGSIASAICYLSWSILDCTGHEKRLRPVEEIKSWSKSVHQEKVTGINGIGHTERLNGSNGVYSAEGSAGDKLYTVKKAREMGRALQLVNISRDIMKDAKMNRLYIPLEWFDKHQWQSFIRAPLAESTGMNGHISSSQSNCKEYNIPLLDMADKMRLDSESAIANLPRTARGGTRAMVASYFEIAKAIRSRDGRIDEKGIKVDKRKRLNAAALAMWGLT